jgi:outer membrane protein assembly factor BamB
MTASRPKRINRRRFVASSAVGGAAVLTGGQLPPVKNRAGTSAVLAQDTSSDVPMFRGNPARTGEMPGPGPDDSNGVEIFWQYDIDGFILYSPAVVDGVAYVVNQGEYGSTISAVSVEDGSERWRIATDFALSSPVVADGVVFTGGYSLDAGSSTLHAVSATDGSERWRFTTEGWLTFPAVVDGVVFVGNDEGTLYAVDASDGSERWRFASASNTVSMPAVADGVVYAAGSGGILYAVNAEDGIEIWRLVTMSEGSLDVPVVVNGVVYVGGYQLLCAVDARDGTERWRVDTLSDHVSSPAVTDGIAIAGGSGLYAVNADDGSALWQFVPEWGSVGSAVVADGIVYTGGDSGTMFALDMETGVMRWILPTPSDVLYAPAVVDGMLLAGCYRGNLFAIGGRVPELGAGGTARATEPTPLRGTPSPTGSERAKLDAGTVVTITGDTLTTGDIAWWPVTVNDSGDQGWVEASKLEPLTSAPEPTATP